MSFDSNPEWADIKINGIEILKCKTCGWSPPKEDKDLYGDEGLLENIYANTYYKARHVPREIYITCENEDCPQCDEDTVYTLDVLITITEAKDNDQ